MTIILVSTIAISFIGACATFHNNDVVLRYKFFNIWDMYIRNSYYDGISVKHLLITMLLVEIFSSKFQKAFTGILFSLLHCSVSWAKPLFSAYFTIALLGYFYSLSYCRNQYILDCFHTKFCFIEFIFIDG